MKTKSRALPRRSMTTDEITMARAVSPATVRYVPASPDKRFAWSIADQAEHGTPPSITDRQAQDLISLVIRMRRQMAPDVLAIADRLAKRSGDTAPRRGLSATTAAALLLLAVSAAGCRSCRYVPPGCNAPAPAPAPKDTVVQ